MESNEEGSSELRSYYSVLGLDRDSSEGDVRRAYRRLAMQWHPDKWSRSPSLLGVAKQKFQEIQEAYSVLSDQKKRTLYDAGLYDLYEEEDEGFAEFLQEMMPLMAAGKESRNYTMEELQGMFWEMAEGFEFPEWPDFPQPAALNQSPQRCFGPFEFDDSRNTKRARWDTNPFGESSYFGMLGLDVSGADRFCR